MKKKSEKILQLMQETIKSNTGIIVQYMVYGKKDLQKSYIDDLITENVLLRRLIETIKKEIM